jgi:sugar phosphate isomerase/epimerase
MMDEQRHFIRLLEKVQVNVPFLRLKNEYLALFMEYGMNPEIGIDAGAIDSISDKEFKNIAEILKINQRKITLHGPFMDLVPGGLDSMLLAATRNRLDRFFEIIPIFEPIHVVCHTGYDPGHYRENWNEWLANSIATWKSYVGLAERFGFKLLLENVYEKNPEVHLAFFDAISSDHFGFCLDIGHHHVFGKSPLKEWVERLGEKIMALHLHDNDGQEDSHLAIGKGNADFRGLFQLISERGLRPTVILEPHEEETLWQSLASEGFKNFIRTFP